MSTLPNDHLPPELAAAADLHWQRLIEQMPPALAEQLARDGGRELATVLATSEFVAESAARFPEEFAAFVASGAPEKPLDEAELDALIQRESKGADSIDALKPMLRRVRRIAMWRLIWREATRRSSFAETVTGVTMLAERCIDAALDRLTEAAAETDGMPTGATSGEPVRMVVMALGKLGARELNLSSDIDLVFSYAEDGMTSGGRRTNQQFFLRLAAKLIQALDDVTVDGFVFRVDMRLRPYGDTGAYVHHFAAMESYFEEQGRDWERYAWIRARPCAGSRADGERLIEMLRPFVFRKYLDFGAIQALRDMKARVESERSAFSVRDDVKLGPGGIREVEFIVQLLQLIWGARHPALRGVSTLENLEHLVEARRLGRSQADELRAAYVFLRDTEHKLQLIRDEQTQRLPDGALDRARVAHMMRYESWQTFADALARHRANVSRQFDTLVASPTEHDHAWRLVWTEPDPARLAERLAAAGYPDADKASQALVGLRVARDRPRVGAEGRDRLDQLMPRVLEAVARVRRPTVALGRVVALLEAVMRRSAYFVLLLENPSVLTELVSICEASGWLAAELARHPMLLDELLDPTLLYTVPDRSALARDLRARLASAGDSGEAALEVLRVFKESHQFRVAACELRGILPLMKISDYLTFLAEVILNEALAMAWREAEAASPAPLKSRPFVIVGYGKLGGLELGPGSDLDLVFLHDLPSGTERTLSRMIRRLLHILTTRTHTGALYEVDTRLRPSGRFGTMVTSLAAFEEYQNSDAWVWEYQALVRARVVAGDAALAARFEALRDKIIRRRRDREELRAKIVEMRERIARSAAEDVDFKRGVGGIVDIEFMVQYLALAYAADYPSLSEFTDNVRILDAAARENLLPTVEAERLKAAYLALRAESHRTALDEPDAERARRVLEAHAEAVRSNWNRLLGAEPTSERPR